MLEEFFQLTSADIVLVSPQENKYLGGVLG